MKLITLLLLIICESFMVTTIEAVKCKNPIIFWKGFQLKFPIIFNLEQLFGKGFLPNKSILINGEVLANPQDFDFVVNLFEDGVMYETANLPFHFTPRFHFNPPRVVRNNWSKDKGWGPEDTSGSFPFKAGQPFILEFVAAPKNTIIININNKRFATFSRVDLSKISQIYINGINSILVNILTLCPNQEKKRCRNKMHCQFCNQSQICNEYVYPNPCV